jgi:hypothetical protein
MEEIEISYIDLLNYNIKKSTTNGRGRRSALNIKQGAINCSTTFRGEAKALQKKNKHEVIKINLQADSMDCRNCETRTFHALNIV